MFTEHGNDIYDYPDKIRCDFSSNIPYRNNSGIIADYLKNCMDTIRNYPDPNARKLISRLADHHAVSADYILVTNGSSEAFYLLAHLFRKQHSTIPYPAFSEYEDACRANEHEIWQLPVESLPSAIGFKTNTVWFGVPNNPDGTIVDNTTISHFCSKNPRTWFIVDTAYDDLCPRNESVQSLQRRFKNLITVHSLTKTFGIPGLRLGYIIAEPHIIEQLRLLSPPWSMNALALEAGTFILDNWGKLLPDTVSLCTESARLQQQLGALPHLEVIPSPCHFFLIKMKVKTAAELKRFLVEQFGLLIRDASNFRGLTSQHFRISTQEKAWNRQLIEALEVFFADSVSTSI